MISYKTKITAILILCCVSLLLCFYRGIIMESLKYHLYKTEITKNVCPDHCSQHMCLELKELFDEISSTSNNLTLRIFQLLQDFSCFDMNPNLHESTVKLMSIGIKSEIQSHLLEPKQNSKTELLDICPEIYKGMKYGFPDFVTGFVYEDCTNSKHLSDVVTVILNSFTTLFNLSNIIQKIEFEYPYLTVLIPTTKYNVTYSNSSNIKLIYYKEKPSLGAMWNDLLNKVNTPYVFIGENIEDFTMHTRFKRQISMLSAFDNVGIVGGAIRNREGFWIYNCYQQKMYNYILKFEEGYYKSRNECMICDYLEAPFMAKSAILQQIKFDSKLEANIFVDLFIRLKKQKILILSCVDVMNYVHLLFKEKKTNWLPVAKKWHLNRIVLPTGVIHSFDCDETNMECNPFEITKQHLMPICCMDLMANALIKLTQLCEQLNITFMIDSGSILGAIKLYYPMPWDLDGDACFRDVDFKHFQTNVPTLGYKVTWDKLKTQNNITSTSGNLYIKPSLYIELWPWDFPAGYIMSGKKQTRIKIGNYYVYVPNNPGLFVRNRYGRNILKHSVSWITLGKKDSWTQYDEAGRFPACKETENHACYDKFSADGNIQFKIP